MRLCLAIGCPAVVTIPCLAMARTASTWERSVLLQPFDTEPIHQIRVPDWLEDLVRRMQQCLKGIKRDLALMTWTTNAGHFGHFLSTPRNTPARMNLPSDAPDQELWMDETNRGATIVPEEQTHFTSRIAASRVRMRRGSVASWRH